MNAYLKYLIIQFKMDFRDKGVLLTYYLVPLLFFFVMGAVFSSITPDMRATLACAMTIFAATMGAIMGAPVPLVKMRESGTMRAFKVNGIKSHAVLFIASLSAFIHLFIVSVIIYIVSPLAFHSDLPINPAAYFGILSLFLITSIGVGMLIGVYAKSQSFVTMLSMLVFLPSLLFSGIMFPASMLPKLLSLLGRIFPATHALQAFTGFAFHTETAINPWVSTGVMIFIGLAAFMLAVLRLNRISQSEQD